METIADRIMKVVELTTEGNKSRFAQKINVTPAYISKIGKERETIPSERTISDICRVFGVSRIWLRTGEREMFEKTDPDEEFARIMAEIQADDDKIVIAVLKAYWGLNEEQKRGVRELIHKIVEETQKLGDSKTSGE